MASIREILDHVQAADARGRDEERVEFEKNLRAAKAGDAEAMFSVGVDLENGCGAPADVATAARWYERAAALGHCDAIYNRGLLYDDAEVFEAARIWYARSAELGDAASMSNLGLLHERGDGGDVDTGAAMEWYRRSTELDHVQARVNLGRLLRDRDPTGAAYRYAELFRDAAEDGHRSGMAEWATCLDGGTGVEASPSAAEGWMRKAAILGYEDAIAWLAERDLWVRKPWVWIPGVSLGPVRLGEPVDRYVDALSLVVDEEDDDRRVDADDADWNSERYGVRLDTEHRRVTGAVVSVSSAVQVFYRDCDLLRCALEPALRALDARDMEVESLVLLRRTFTLQSDSMSLMLYSEDGVIERLYASLDGNHPLWSSDDGNT